MTPHPKVEMIKLEGDFEVHADILTMHISCCSWEPIFGMHHPLRSKLSNQIPASNMGDDLKPAVLSAHNHLAGWNTTVCGNTWGKCSTMLYKWVSFSLDTLYQAKILHDIINRSDLPTKIVMCA